MSKPSLLHSQLFLGNEGRDSRVNTVARVWSGERLPENDACHLQRALQMRYGNRFRMRTFELAFEGCCVTFKVPEYANTFECGDAWYLRSWLRVQVSNILIIKDMIMMDELDHRHRSCTCMHVHAFMANVDQSAILRTRNIYVIFYCHSHHVTGTLRRRAKSYVRVRQTSGPLPRHVAQVCLRYRS
jgi:hypothetical protein